ncbi:hypothetical protein D3C78_1087750 [compost metagenome]
MFQATTQAQVEALAGLPLFEHEQRQAIGIALRDEGLLTEGGKLVAADLGTDHAFHRPPGLMPGFDPCFVTLVLEGGVHFAAFHFTMLVIGVADVELQCAEGAIEIAQLGGETVVILLHVQTHAGLGHRAIVRVVAAVGQAGIAVIPMVGTADGTAILAAVAVFQAMLAARLVGVADLGTAGVAWDAQVVELPAVGVQVQGKAAIAGFQLAGAAACGVGTAVAQLASAMNAVDGVGGDAVVEAVDHATNGIATVEQGGRAADDFDAIYGGRVQRYGVIVGQR